MKCANHPKTETNLRCGKCGKPICPKCMVDTPVGVRCRECAALSKAPTYDLSTKYKVQALVASIGCGVVLGVLWGLINQAFSLLYMNLLIAALAGYASGEIIGHATNKKRGNLPSIFAGLAVVIAFVVSILPPWGSLFEGASIMVIILDIISVCVGVFVAAGRLR